MPRVHYMRPVQGFRPYTNPERAVGLKGQAIPLSLVNATPSTPSQIVAAAVAAGDPVPDAADLCSSWDFYFDPASWKSCVAETEKAQIQAVPTRAQAAGYPSDVVATAQSAADQASGSVPSDVASVSSTYAAGALIQPSVTPWWIWAALVGIGYFALKEL